jgi:hypothetical protein
LSINYSAATLEVAAKIKQRLALPATVQTWPANNVGRHLFDHKL